MLLNFLKKTLRLVSTKNFQIKKVAQILSNFFVVYFKYFKNKINLGENWQRNASFLFLLLLLPFQSFSNFYGVELENGGDMKLEKLIENLDANVVGETDHEIFDITYNSKEVTKGSLFVCIRGGNSDGHDFAKDAEKNGAAAILCEKQVQVNIPQIIVSSTRKALSKVFSCFYDNPQNKLKIIGITGTNGKTTTSFLIKSILEESGKKVGLIGTQGAFIGKQFFQTGLTTPDPQFLFKLLKQMVDFGVEYVVMEVSAHALSLDKTEGIVFEVGVLTNLTQDHLDFFKTMENYKHAKLKLFERNKIKSAVLNFDDEFGRELGETIDVPFLSYSLNNPSDVFAAKIGNKNGKNKFIVNILDNVFDVESNLIGEFNIYNSLAATSVAAMLGCSPKQIKSGLEKLSGVEGRLNRFNLSNGVVAFIDFAHTPDGIEKALNAIRELKFKQIITVFGCSGNRDKDKRHKMGQIAEKLSDYVVLTTDNPRFENPELILDDIEIGMEKTAHTRFVSREQAIEFALTLAKKGDCVAILGKGAETYQDINGVNVPYNDFEVVKNFDDNLRREFFENNLKA